MQVSKKFFSIAAAVFSLALNANTQTIPQPSMPTITSPTIGNGFYMPGNSKNRAYTGDSSKPETISETEPKEDNDSSNASPDTEADARKAVSGLTANDIQNLNNEGLLDKILELSDSGSSQHSLSLTDSPELGLYSAQINTTSGLLLRNLLTQLQNSQKTVHASSGTEISSEAAPEKVSAAKSAEQENTSRPHLIRFSVNGYDILRTCQKIYISSVQNDGTFLVTGDRKYLSDGENRSETFHILFTRLEAESGLKNYTAAAAVTQDRLNVYSFLYQLSQRENLKATRTGNLVTMRTTDSDWKLELLIDLGE